MFLHVFAHIDAHHVALIIKEYLSQGFGQLGFAYAGGAQEDEGANGTVGVLDAGTSAYHGLADGLHSLILTYYTLMQDFLKVY